MHRLGLPDVIGDILEHWGLIFCKFCNSLVQQDLLGLAEL
jgi:hypothetical protein